jgi:EF-P beta-lysylation protein EpmB
MIPRTATAWQTPEWQIALAGAFSSVEELLGYLDLDRSQIPELKTGPSRFGLRVPRGFAALIEKGNPNDPILRQILPIGAEERLQPGFTADPVGDLVTQGRPGLLHKYYGRALLIASEACAVHCRYCFRRHYPYRESTASRGRWQQALDYLHQDRSIEEVILSGGDPLTLSDDRLEALLIQLAAIPHLRRLRIHSRLPVVIPERMTPKLVELLTGGRLDAILVFHINHSAEMSEAFRQRIGPLSSTCITLLNQSVLLAGVNDSADTLAELSHSLFRSGILPYYLHQLDRVQGAAHFEVPDRRALEINCALRARLPGYLMPRLVREKAGELSKIPLGLPC